IKTAVRLTAQRSGIEAFGLAGMSAEVRAFACLTQVEHAVAAGGGNAAASAAARHGATLSSAALPGAALPGAALPGAGLAAAGGGCGKRRTLRWAFTAGASGWP